ncbi:MAG: hypothetical protein HGA83_07825, partial [Bacteroidales bacterium]|nr:hypothetical protein [Bacteroidales bacterium]
MTSSVTAGGDVTSNGGDLVIARGICWSISLNPTISDSKTTVGTGNGIFTSSVTGLAANTRYNLRAYATNSIGTSYGSNVAFTTLPNSICEFDFLISSTNLSGRPQGVLPQKGEIPGKDGGGDL